MLRAALYTADPWDSALVEIRVRRPAQYAGVEILKGVSDGVIDHTLVEQVDIVILQRDFPRFSGSIELVNAAKNLHKRVVYETDDWLFDVPEWNVQHEAYQHYLNGMLWTLIQADRVVTCSTLLSEKLAYFNPNVSMFENYLVDELWPLRQPVQAKEGQLRIGFMGSQTHQEDVRWLAPVLRDVLDRYAGKMNLVFWGCQPPDDLRGRPDVHWHDLQFQSYQEFAGYFSEQACDIFIAPLTDNEFNRAKSPLKYFEYTSLGVPGVYSQIDPYARVITDGENGLLAATLPEWREKLETLILSSDLRTQLAGEAQRRVKRDWLLSDHAQAWLYAVSGAGSAARRSLSPVQSVTSHITLNTQREIWEMEAKIGELSQEVVDLRNHLEGVLASRTWNLARKFQKIIDLVRPRK